jgi:predicted alpha-1,2-mannosidase
MARVRTSILALLFLLMTPITGDTKTPYESVDPFIGTGGFGHTYPGASLPFGMVQLSPDTRTSGWENCSGYHASNPTIIGFSHTHLSGTGAMDLGDILFAPTTGDLQLTAGDEAAPASGYRSAYRHDTESAAPGYYSVLLDDHGIRAELTATERAGFHRYTFPRSGRSHVIIDLQHGLGDRVRTAEVRVTGNAEISGFRRSSGWAADHTVYFVARFSKPFEDCGTAVDDVPNPWDRRARGKNVKGFVTFPTEDGEQVLVKIGISAVSIAGARKNLEAEIPGWDFDGVRARAATVWSEALASIRVDSASDEAKTVFYTALYHSMLCPNLFTDVDGRYRGADGRVHRTTDGPIYTVFSLWDTFRATHPLFTIIAPEIDAAFVRSLLAKYDESGYLPVWELHANETNCMIGYHSVPVIVDAYVKGIRGFDAEKAYEAMKRSAERDHRGLEHYRALGYIPSNKQNESVSKTLEYAYDDWCIAEMAKKLGRVDDVAVYTRRAKSYANLFDLGTGFMRAKKDGNWVEPFDPNEVTTAYTEATAWQYRFFVPHDLDSLIAFAGGDERFIENLDSVFTASTELRGRDQPDISGLIGQYAHGNEPSHHMAYLYNYAGAPWKTQERTRAIMTTLYKTGREGLCGNDDCGQMSAWYVLSAMGFYPVCPGSDEYVIGAPILERVEVAVGGGSTFTVVAKNLSAKNKYIQRATLNGSPFNKSFLRHADIVRGGELVFEMGDGPNPAWGSNKNDRPASVMAEKFVMNPFYVAPSRSFCDSMTVEIRCFTPGAEIRYTTDGTRPTEHSTRYDGPVTLREKTTLKAIALRHGMEPSSVESVDYIMMPYRRTIVYDHPYHRAYTAGGDSGLLDGIRGETASFSEWQGFLGVDLAATIDLGEERRIRRISAGFLQDYGSWIFLPRSVEYAISADGERFTRIGTVTNPIPPERGGSFVREFEKRIRNGKARYVRIVARNIGVNPPGHPGAGEKAFIFADEIVIE